MPVRKRFAHVGAEGTVKKGCEKEFKNFIFSQPLFICSRFNKQLFQPFPQRLHHSFQHLDARIIFIVGFHHNPGGIGGGGVDQHLIHGGFVFIPFGPVSYTHLDVYKRQGISCSA